MSKTSYSARLDKHDKRIRDLEEHQNHNTTALAHNKVDSAQKKERNYFIIIPKALGLLILFFGWIIEHERVQKLENISNEYIEKHADVLASSFYLRVNNLVKGLTKFAKDHTAITDSEKTKLNLEAYQDYIADGLTMMYSQDIVGNLNKKLVPDSILAIDSSRLNNWFNYSLSVYQSKDLNKLMAIADTVDDQLHKSLATNLNLARIFRKQTGEKYESADNTFILAYIVGSLLLALSFFLENSPYGEKLNKLWVNYWLERGLTKKGRFP